MFTSLRLIHTVDIKKNRLNYKKNNQINLYLPWNIAELILIRTMDMIVPVQKLSCHWSVSTLVITQVTPNKRMTKIKLTNNLGVVLKWWPNEAFNNRNVTLGTMEAIAIFEFHEICTSFLSAPMGEGLLPDKKNEKNNNIKNHIYVRP